MFQPQNLARTARVTNAMVWFGLAVCFLGFAGERTYTAFTAGGGVLVGGSSSSPPRPSWRRSARSRPCVCATSRAKPQASRRG